jgi:2-polyprenyl-3-methyl-5-hydroxy-6-metoxy-1,4-benzoquinol methylase
MSNSLLSGGKHYDKLVNWEKRLSLEIPFLNSFLTGFEPPIKSILEVGCGTGRHAQILQQENKFQITGVDIDESMIDEARKRIPEARLYVHDILDTEFLQEEEGKFDAIISLGNTVGLVSRDSFYDLIIKRFSQFLKKPKGILIFQLLNTERERNGWSQPRSILTDEGEFIFLRGFETTEKFIHPEIITLFKAKNEKNWVISSTGRSNIPRIKKKEMTSLLELNGFKKINVFGDYKKSLFHSEKSVDMIFVAYT